MPATFVVEDGSGKSDANSYIDRAGADQYNLDHAADTVWSGATDAAKEKALRLATQYLDAKYGQRWKGERSNDDQALDWPRQNVETRDGDLIENDEMPAALLNATVEMAIASANGTILVPTLTNSGTVKRYRVKVGPLEEETEYSAANPPNTYFQLADDLVADLINGGAGSIPIERS